MVISEEAKKRFLNASVDRKITCEQCLNIGNEMGLENKEIASTLTEMGIKIIHCQLGCFP
jgi:hypothetical protein